MFACYAGTGGARFVPEFMKPQSLRCSTLTAPWEEQRCHRMADTRRMQEAAGKCGCGCVIFRETLVPCWVRQLLSTCAAAV